MAPIAESFVRLRPDAGPQFDRELEREVGQATDRAGRTVGKRFSTTFGKALRTGGILAGAGLLAAAGGIHRFVEDARESVKIGRLTAAVVKSTGKAAGLSAKQIGDLATSISNKTGVDDEAIQSGANLLATFTNVRNEVGRGNDVFTQATQAITDMSSALGTEPRNAALQLGKALNDPIKGVTALTRSGVSFTQQQKDQIKTLVESGKTLDAQKIILGEVGKEFGGAAKAAHDPVDRLRVVVGNLSEKIGTALLPYIDKAAGFLGDFVQGMVDGEGPGGTFRDVVGEVAGQIESVVEFAKDVPGAVSGMVSGISTAAGQIAQVATTFVQPLIDALTTGVQTGDWGPLGVAIGDALARTASGGAGLARAVAAWAASVDWLNVGKQTAHVVVPFAIGLVNELANAFFDAALEHPLDVLAFIAAFIPVGRIAGILEKLLGRLPIAGPILRALSSAGGAVESAANRFIVQPLIRGAERFAPGLVLAVRNGMHDAVFVIRSYVDDLANLGRRLMGSLRDGIDNGATAVVLGIRLLIRDILRFFRADLLYNAGRDIVLGLARGIRASAGAVISAAADLASSIPGWVKKVLRIGSPSKVMHDLGDWAGKGMAGGLVASTRDVEAAAADMGKRTVKALSDQLDKVRSKITDLKSAARDVRQSVAGAITGSLDISSLRPGPGAFFDVKALAAKATRFANLLAQLVQKHIAPSLIQQIAEAGPEAGTPVAESFLALGRGQRRELNTAYAQIDTAANRAGRTVARAQDYPDRIAHQQRVEAKLERLIAAVKANRHATLTVKGDGNAATAVRHATLALDF